MKLDRLTSTTQHLSQESRERARHVAAESIRQVAAMEGVEGDRQRSLQQEVAEFDQKAIASFAGGELVVAAAHEIAAQLAALDKSNNTLLKTPDLHLLHQVDLKMTEAARPRLALPSPSSSSAPCSSAMRETIDRPRPLPG